MAIIARGASLVHTERVQPRFEKLAHVFRENFASGDEQDGAAFAVYVDGVLVADFWGGLADSTCNRLWRAETMCPIWSCSKGLSAIVFAVLVDRGALKYSDKVVDYWPAYGQAGKQETTIEQLLHHQAGVPYICAADGAPARLNIDEATDRIFVERLIEAQAPLWPPGTATAYHSFSLGYLLDGVCRRADARGRSVGEFFRDEIARKHDLDVFIGGTAAEEHRIARTHAPSLRFTARELWLAPSSWQRWKLFASGTIFSKILENTDEIAPITAKANNPEFRKIGLPSVNGVATARSLARTYELLRSGALVSAEMLEALKEPRVVDEPDRTLLDAPLSRGVGFAYARDGQGGWLTGHPGIGGQYAFINWQRKVVVAYVTNCIKGCDGAGMCQALNNLLKALDECL